MNPNVLPTLTCGHCGSIIFEKVEIGQFREKPDWLVRGLPLPKHTADEWSQGGGIVYRCFECGTPANKPRA